MKSLRNNRRATLLVATALLAASLLCGCGGTFTTPSGDRIVADPASFTIQRENGDQSARTEKRQVTIHNRSKKAVTLRNVLSSCACADVSLPPNPSIAAGDSAEMTISVSVPVAGRRVAELKLLTDSVETPELAIRLELIGAAVPAPRIMAMSQEVRRRCQEAGPLPETFEVSTLEPLDEEDWLEGFESTATWLSAVRENRKQIRKLDDKVAEYVYEFSLHSSEGLPVGDRRMVLLSAVVRSAPIKPHGMMAVILENPERVSFVPPSILVDSGNTAEGIITLFAEETADWECEVKSMPAGMTISQANSAVELLPGAKRFHWHWSRADSDGVDGELVFASNLIDAAEFRVPVRLQNGR